MTECFVIRFMDFFIFFIIISFACWCEFLACVLSDVDSWWGKRFRLKMFTKDTTTWQDYLDFLWLLMVVMFPTVGCMIIIVWLTRNWSYIMSLLPCVVFV